MSTDLDIVVLPLALIPTSVPIPLRIIGTDQFDWRAAFTNELQGLHTQIENVTIDHNTLYRYALDELGAIVHSVDQMKLENETSRSMIETETLQRVETNFALSQQITGLVASTNTSLAQIQETQTALATADTALTSRIDTQLSLIDGALAEIEEERTTRVSALEAVAEDIQILEVSLGGDIAAVQTYAEAEINTQTGKINAIWGVNVNVNGLVGGFKLTNDSDSIDAVFDVDNFYIGKTTGNKVKPFFIESGVTYIDDARIKKVTFDKLRSSDGSVLIENGKIKTQYLNVGNSIMGGAFTGWGWPASGQVGFYLGPEGLLLGNSNDNRYLRVDGNGNLYAPQFSIVNGNAVFGGDLQADKVFVNTAHIAGQAVTFMASAEGVEYAEVGIVPTGGKVIIFGSGSATDLPAGSAGASAGISISRWTAASGWVGLHNLNEDGSDGQTFSMATSFSDPNAPVGVYTVYRVSFGAYSNGAGYGYSSILVQETKR